MLEGSQPTMASAAAQLGRLCETGSGRNKPRRCKCQWMPTIPIRLLGPSASLLGNRFYRCPLQLGNGGATQNNPPHATHPKQKLCFCGGCDGCLFTVGGRHGLSPNFCVRCINNLNPGAYSYSPGGTGHRHGGHDGARRDDGPADVSRNFP